MCGFSKPKAPPPVQIPVAPPAPTITGDEVSVASDNAADDAKRRRIAAQESSTIVTGAQGLTAPAATTTKNQFGV